MMKKLLKNNIKKNNKGITLITLVITIIVLTILASVILSSLTSEDKNIVERSKESKNNLEVGQETEILKGILIEIQSKQFNDSQAKIEYIEDALTNEGISDFEVGTESVSIKDREYTYTDIFPEFSGI